MRVQEPRGLRFRHLPPEVPESTTIADNPRASAPSVVRWLLANSLLIRTFQRGICQESRWIAPRRSPVRVRLAP
jgi:hypothetical protein